MSAAAGATLSLRPHFSGGGDKCVDCRPRIENIADSTLLRIKNAMHDKTKKQTNKTENGNGA
jgi:hypothetical protein